MSGEALRSVPFEDVRAALVGLADKALLSEGFTIEKAKRVVFERRADGVYAVGTFSGWKNVDGGLDIGTEVTVETKLWEDKS